MVSYSKWSTSFLSPPCRQEKDQMLFEGDTAPAVNPRDEVNGRISNLFHLTASVFVHLLLNSFIEHFFFWSDVHCDFKECFIEERHACLQPPGHCRSKINKTLHQPYICTLNTYVFTCSLLSSQTCASFWRVAHILGGTSFHREQRGSKDSLSDIVIVGF